jgi:hypothetical protein
LRHSPCVLFDTTRELTQKSHRPEYRRRIVLGSILIGDQTRMPCRCGSSVERFRFCGGQFQWVRKAVAPQPTWAMNAKLLLLFTVSLGVAGVASARDEPSPFRATTTPKAKTQWNTDPKYWERVLRVPKEFPDVKLGRSDFVISGPLIDGLRRRRSAPDLSRGQRFLRLPIVRLFVPGPMPSPPGGGKYFLWGESSRPWSALAEGAAAGDLSNPVTHQARSLISISR